MLGLMLLVFPAHAQDTTTATDPTLTAEAGQVSVDGFRSAKFGMSIDEVRDAIAADFGLADADIVADVNRAERTQLLSILVPDLLPEGGIAQVSYVFGYQSGGLIQVGVSWSPASDPALTEEALYANADALAAHFMAAGYDPGTIRSSLVLDTGILLFRGEDAEGRATILLLQGEYIDLGEGQHALTPTALALLYAADAENPDVFRIEAGQF